MRPAVHLMRRASLRVRLLVVILTPLLAMGIVLGVWRVGVAQQTAEELFDRSLLAAALAISRDVVLSEGDAILPSTRDLIRDASGGEVFYHATGPGGIYVTGYAYPPVNPDSRATSLFDPRFFEARYRGEDVRVLQVAERITIENLTGDATVTVWQRIADRDAFVRELVIRSAALIGGLLTTLVLVVWFGVKLGLRPLTDLQDAISIRSPNDLSRIKRVVPAETRGIVRTLNQLFGQVESSIKAHQDFISDAAHQLRNPAAAVQSMAEAVRDAPNEAERERRTDEMVAAARSSARVADQLLSLERLRHISDDGHQEQFDLTEHVQTICAEAAPEILSRGVEFELILPEHPVPVRGDRVFIGEAIKNLIDNALKHGGPDLASVLVEMQASQDVVSVSVRDDGRGLSPSDREVALGRFSQVSSNDGSGLGLAIAVSVAERQGGALSIDDVAEGASLTLSLRREKVARA
ncbi:two-component system sensor histidine kinase TctE [Shimia isoporae]|uniref:histidine kinase n=1 Tax=Shimia isoporae TaxID=647720 RepID=A0A4R1N2A6_9RHOB|nr:sensor histidine kinase [Shimia isoporae]TCK99291.1 two-component system sensor histidine kinase TctE [Shimia isoporae]